MPPIGGVDRVIFKLYYPDTALYKPAERDGKGDKNARNIGEFEEVIMGRSRLLFVSLLCILSTLIGVDAARSLSVVTGLASLFTAIIALSATSALMYHIELRKSQAVFQVIIPCILIAFLANFAYIAFYTSFHPFLSKTAACIALLVAVFTGSSLDPAIVVLESIWTQYK